MEEYIRQYIIIEDIIRAKVESVVTLYTICRLVNSGPITV